MSESWITVIGTLLGVVVGGVVTALVEFARQSRELSFHRRTQLFDAYVAWFRAYEVFRSKTAALLSNIPTGLGVEAEQAKMAAVIEEAGLAAQEFGIAKNALFLRETDTRNRSAIQQIHTALSPYDLVSDMDVDTSTTRAAQLEAFKASIAYEEKKAKALSHLAQLIDRVAGVKSGKKLPT